MFIYCSKIHKSIQIAIYWTVPNIPIVSCECYKTKRFFRICNATFLAKNLRLLIEESTHEVDWIAYASTLGDNVRMIVNIASKKILSFGAK